MRLVENDNQRRQQAIQTLGKLKAVAAAEVIANRLQDFFVRQAAADALKEIGPPAQKAVLKFYNHPDGGVRGLVRNILQGQNISASVFLGQSLTDLESPDQRVRSAALQWFAENPADPQRKLEVSRALNKPLETDGNLRSQYLAKALENWGTSENVPRLIGILEAAKLRRADVVVILGKIGDPNGLKAVARRISNFFDAGEVQRVLKECGSAAEPAVIEVMTNTPDGRTRTDCARVLGDIGTRNVSGQALQNMLLRMQQLPQVQQDRQFMATAQFALQTINNRGK
jgi:HEAT repeat protein